MDRTVIRYSHCLREIYCFSEDNNVSGSFYGEAYGNKDTKRKTCPICSGPLKFSLLDAPRIVPCPFSNGHRVPCAFIIGSVHGPLFLGEWSDTELHVGISNSEGLVYNYTLSGIRTEEQGWEQCICIRLVPPCREDLTEVWDKELQQFSSLPMWDPDRFNEEREFGSCCYGFALTFINHMRSLEQKASLSRDDFTRMYVLPHMKTASKYLRVYQNILQHGFHIAGT
ncbi:MKRN2 opposite strand, tandem duplicate 1 [Chanos chanos]|uniref:MKRN2 opposite strand, tandem duplicate 1 n=1 Tax=Chanos chanos TaxID=29144 RepID=A0A6J2VSF1_CHACN|nr:MKRN2 opposite strand protein-like [Chanos chanos]